MFTRRVVARLSRLNTRSATAAGYHSLCWPNTNQNRVPTATTASEVFNQNNGPLRRRLFSSQIETESSLDTATYERVCSETLDGLCDYFEELTENATDLIGTDVAYGDGVLTVNLGKSHGTYVINRQTPNKQIWLSSPTSGPKRFDYVGTPKAGKWIYRHSGQSLHQLLQLEIPNIVKSQTVDFMRLPHCS
ncbi:GL26832 [Drosophila persimilis]|uniref:ferroxidase n=1 Tax=Drosophila persimilis TaxID=7234 RepID=B4H2F5_DROPE|nr:frataxin homolog, mitochondrial [Drosophila persimilis]EDW30522.1 GL26832 [Drosophila persimilis]